MNGRKYLANLVKNATVEEMENLFICPGCVGLDDNCDNPARMDHIPCVECWEIALESEVKPCQTKSK